jgi:serine/threonine protein kinase
VLAQLDLAGTLDYMAPEVLRCPLKRHPGNNKDRADLHYATAVDAWAVGVLAYELLTGRWALRKRACTVWRAVSGCVKLAACSRCMGNSPYMRAPALACKVY